MNRKRKQKLFIMGILFVVIAGMSIGFATFSRILTISSKAIVDPNLTNFKIKMYGLIADSHYDIFEFDKYISDNNASMFEGDLTSDGVVISNEIASIDSDSLSLNIDIVNMVNPSDVRAVVVKVVNEGSYDAYFDTSQLENHYLPTCTPGEGTSQTLVDEVCGYISINLDLGTEHTLIANKELMDGTISSEEFDLIAQQDCFVKRNGVCKLLKGESIFLLVVVSYDYHLIDGIDVTPRADGPFSATFPEIKLEFTSNGTSNE